MQKILPAFVLLVLPPLLSLPAAAANTLITTDGRVVEGFPLERQRDGALVKFRNGSITVPTALIRILVLDAENESNAEARRAAEEAILRRSWQNRHRMKTEHFVFEFTVPDAMMKPVSERFEAFAAALYEEWGRKLSTSDRLRVMVANSAAQAEQVFGLAPTSPGQLAREPGPEIQIHLDYRDVAGGEKALRTLLSQHLLREIGPDLEYPLFPRVPLGDFCAAGRAGATADAGQQARLAYEMKFGFTPSIEAVVTNPITIDTRPFAFALVRFLLSSEAWAPRFRSYVVRLADGERVRRVEVPGFTGKRIHPGENLLVLKAALGIGNDEELEALNREWQATLSEAPEPEGLEDCLDAARTSRRLGDRKRALALYERAVDLGCERSMVYFEIGQVMMEEGSLTGAMKAWQTARDLDPLDPAVTGALGRLLLRKGARNEGMRLLDLALEISGTIR